MPKSRGRKPKRRQVPAQRRPPAGGSFGPGKFALAEGKITTLLAQAPGELLPLLFPPMLWVKLAEGRQANVCVDACAILQHTYAQFGIEAHLVPIGLAVEDEHGRSTEYFTTRPHWEAGNVYVGHSILVLPELGRIVDPAIEQVPAIRKLALGPLVGRVPPEVAKGIRLGNNVFGVSRGDLLIAYLPVDPDCADVLDGAPALVDHVEAHRRAGINLATLALDAFRASFLADRICQAPYPRLHALLDAIDSAPIERDHAGNVRIALGDGQAVLLDEIDLFA